MARTILKTWRAKLDDALRNGMKYCFNPVEGKFPTLNEEEYDPSNTMGFLDFLVSFFQSERQRCFYRGYRLGAEHVVEDLLTQQGIEIEFDKDLNKHGASRAWESEEKRGVTTGLEGEPPPIDPSSEPQEPL